MCSGFRALLVVILFAGLCAGPMGAVSAESASGSWLARTWQTDDGLPDNNVTGVEQTADGYLWVATLGGLVRFDGVRFEVFPTTHFPRVPNRNVRRTYLDRSGQLWLALDRGAVIRVGSASARVFDTDDGFPSSRVTAVAEDDEGGVWFVAGNEFYRIWGDNVQPFSPEHGLPGGGNSSLAQDGKGRLWFARGSRAGIFERGRWETMLILDSNPVRLAPARNGGLWVSTTTRLFRSDREGKLREMAPLPAQVAVRVMLEDRAGALWIGTEASGLLCFRENQIETVAVSHPEISVLKEDHEGNIWVGTLGGGINRLRPRSVDMITPQTGLPFASVRSVCQDAEGLVWVALQNGMVACGQGGQWTVMTRDQGWPGDIANCVTPARKGGVWVGTRSHGVRRLQAGRILQDQPGDGLSGQNVRSLLEAANGDLWVGVENPSRLLLLRQGEVLELQIPPDVRSIRALVEDARGTVWAGTSDGYVLRMDGTNVINEVEAQDADAARTFSVRCLHTTPDGSLWIGYAGWGLGRWHNGRYARITAEQGLYDEYISQMLADGQGGVWFIGNRGLFQVRARDLVAVAEGRMEHLRSMAFGRGEGLQAVQPVYENNPTAWKGDNQLWFSTRNGLVTVHPDSIRDNAVAPPVLLTEMKVDDNLVALLDSKSPLRAPGASRLPDLRAPGWALRLPPRHAKVEFAFTALSFSSPENVHFRYRLKGFDSEWIEAGTLRSAKYPRLPAGRYELEVTACNEAGIWSQTGYHLAFAVQPFYWQTWWFRLAVLGGFTVSVIGLVRYFSFRRLRRELERLERQAELQKERTRIARDMHDEVGAKLSRLSLLSEMASHRTELPPETKDDVAEISDTARETIRSFEEIVWAVNPKNDTLPNLIHYLCRFAEDFFEGSEAHCAFELPGRIPDVQVPTELRHHVFLTAKEAMNNILKHAGARRVWVRLRLADARFEIDIEDDGRGFSEDNAAARPRSGCGLGNMRERMRLAGGQLDIHTQPGKGTRVTMQVPCPLLNPL